MSATGCAIWVASARVDAFVPERIAMSFRWHVGFWMAALVVFVLLLWLLHEILLPFVAGAAPSYLLDPVGERVQRGRLQPPLPPPPILPPLPVRPFILLMPVLPLPRP